MHMLGKYLQEAYGTTKRNILQDTTGMEVPCMLPVVVKNSVGTT